MAFVKGARLLLIMTFDCPSCPQFIYIDIYIRLHKFGKVLLDFFFLLFYWSHKCVTHVNVVVVFFFSFLGKLKSTI